MADLTACTVGARDDLAADDDAAADAGAKGHQNDILIAASAALPLLAEGCHVGVISDCNRDFVQEPGERLLHIHNAPAEVDAVVDDAILQNRSGNTDTDAEDVLLLQALLPALVLYGICNVPKDVLAAIFFSRRDLPLLQKISLYVEETAFDGGAADINSECILCHDPYLSFPVECKTIRR